MKIATLAFSFLLVFSTWVGAKEKTPLTNERSWLLEDEKNTISIFEKEADSVVFVSNSALVRDYFSADIMEVPAGAGTGFIWNKEGYIVTNFHVINGARKISVTLKDGKQVPAQIIGAEPRKDIALIKIEPTADMPNGFSEKLADSSQLVVGQKSIAIGNPFELTNTLTTGVVSALNRTFPAPVGNFTIRDMIQTDAAINPGNSGGPLMDSRGYLIGMNTSIYSKSGTSAGVGFAVPSNTIKRIVTQLIKFGRITQPGLGIEPVPQLYAQYLKIKGVMILSLNAGGAAQKAGLRGLKKKSRREVELGDIITAIDGKKVESLDDIYNILEQKQVGDSVKVDYIREDKKTSTNVTLQKIEY